MKWDGLEWDGIGSWGILYIDNELFLLYMRDGLVFIGFGDWMDG